MSFWDSELIKDVERGQLPVFETRVIFDEKTGVKLAFAILLVIIIAILFTQIVKTYGKKAA